VGSSLSLHDTISIQPSTTIAWRRTASITLPRRQRPFHGTISSSKVREVAPSGRAPDLGQWRNRRLLPSCSPLTCNRDLSHAARGERLLWPRRSGVAVPLAEWLDTGPSRRGADCIAGRTYPGIRGEAKWTCPGPRASTGFDLVADQSDDSVQSLHSPPPVSIVAPLLKREATLSDRSMRSKVLFRGEQAFGLELFYGRRRSTDGSSRFAPPATNSHRERCVSVRLRRNFGKAAALADRSSLPAGEVCHDRRGPQDDPAEIPAVDSEAL